MELLELFKRQLASKSGTSSKNTIKNYISDVRHFMTWFEAVTGSKFDPSSVTADVIILYQNSLGGLVLNGQLQSNSQLSASSMKRHLSSIRKFFTVLEGENVTRENPFKRIATEETVEPTDYWHLKSFKDYLMVGNASKITVKNYLSDISGFARWYEEAILPTIQNPLSSNQGFYLITQSVVEDYRKRLVEIQNAAPRTINRKLSALRRYLEFATRKGFITNQEISISSVEAEIADEVSDLPKVPLSEITTQLATQQRSYSRIPPVRLVQKLFINPYLLLEEGAANAITGFLIGKKVTGIAKLPQKLSAQIASKNALRIQNQGISTLLGVRNIEKEFYAPEKVSLLGLPVHQKLIHHVRFTRPNWYKRYHNYAFVHYVHFALLVIFASGVGVALYQNLVVQKQTPTFAAATAPPRILSFQGRLTDALDNPITSPQPVRFMIYNSLAATGAAELWEETRTISPDQDGIFSVLLGSDTTGANASSCGAFPPGSPYNTACLIPSTVFSDNSQIWLGVTIANSTELAPRQKIATVGYATNSEFLQGLPPTSAVSSFVNAVLALDSTGSFNLNDGIEHTFQVSNGTLTLKAQTLNLTTSLGTNGNIIINPEGLGKVDIQKPIINNSNTGNLVQGGVEINDRFGVLATESAVAAFIVNNNTTGGDIFAASSSGTTKFAIANDGSITSGFYTGQNAVLYGTQTTGLIAQATTASTGLCLQSGASTPTWGTCGSSYWNLTTDNGALTPFSSTLDLLIGGQTTASAKFAFINNASGAPTASISGNLSIAVPTGVNGANSFNMFNGSTLNFQTSAGGNSGLTSRLFIANDGRIGIGTTSPFVRNALDIRGLSGTSSTATISANSSYATLVVDNAGSGDLFAASASGVQNFVIKNNGDIMVGPGGAGKITAAIIDPYLVQNQKTTGIQSLTFQTLGASNADFIFQNVSTELSRLTMAGQLQLPITGSTGGIVLGGDTQLFRGDVNRIDVASGDSFNLVSGSLLTGGTTRIDSSGNGTFNTINVTSCTGCGATGANSPFYQLAGAIVPINSTNDFLLGATSTASAKFAVLNINSGTPTASVSANSGNNALYVTGDGTLATTNRGNLTIGNSSTYNTTGNVLINPNGTGNVGIGTTSPSELLTLASIGSANIKINADTDNATETDIAQLLLTQDGGVSTANLGMDSGNNLVIGVNSSTSPNIYFGTNTTGTTFADSSTAKMTILSGGNVGIGDTSPDAKLEVLGTTEQLRLTYTDGTVDSRMTVNSSGNLTIDNTGTKTTITDNLEVSGRTTQFSNQYPIYRWYWGGSNGDNDWKNIANITNTGVTIYDGYSFSVKITNMNTNAGSSDTPISLQYYASIRGSLAGDNAVVSGPIADYVRVIKTATDVYELQVRQIADWKHMQVEVQALSTCCGSPVLAYVDSPVDGSTSGTVYSAAIDHTDYATNFYIGGSALTFAQATAVNIANSSTTALNFESGLLNLDSQNSRVGIGTTTPTAKLDIAGDASTSGSLVFNGSNKSIDILNGSRLDFQTSPGGDAGLTNRMTLLNNGNFGIGGDTTPDSLLSVGSTSQFQVNSSGAISAATGLTSSGTITFSGFSTNGGLLYTNGSGVLAQTGAGSGSQCLLGGTTPAWGSCAAGGTDSPFYAGSGFIAQNNTTLDLLLGGTSTNSAKFAVLNVNGTGPATATVSGNLIVMPNNGAGGNVGIGTAAPAGKFNVVGSSGSGRGIQIDNREIKFRGDGVAHMSIFGPDTGRSRLSISRSSSNGIMGIEDSELVSFLSTGNVGIGDTSPASMLTVGNGDLFQVNSSGAIAAATGLTSSGTITFSGFSTNGGLLYTNGSGVLAQTGAGSGSQCLLGGTTPTWGSCGTGGASSPFQELSGLIVPLNSTLDFLVGGQSTSSAKFAVLNIAGGTPTASVSAQNAAGQALVLASDGTIQSTRNNNLTLGGNTTGSIILSPSNASGAVGINTSTSLSALEVKGRTGTGTVVINNLPAATTYGAIGFSSPLDGDNYALAGISGGEVILNSPANNPLTLRQGNQTYAIINSTTGYFGIGEAFSSPLSTLHVSGGIKGGRAAAIFDQVGVSSNDILAASSSGITKFVIKNDGTASSSAGFTVDGIGNIQSTNNQTLTIGGGSTGNLILGKAAQTLTLPGFTTNGGLFYTNASGVLAQTGTGGATQCLLGGAGTPTFGSCSGGSNTSPFYEFQGAIVPGNTTEDFILGGTASSSARFIVNGLATGISPTASISATNGNGIYLSAQDGTIQSLRNNTLSIGGSTTGTVAINPLGTNFTGIGTSSPRASLDIRGSLGIIGGGTLAVASISGRTSYAALAIDNLSPVGDLFTASSSSNMQFVIKNNGFVGLATAAPTARLDVNGSASISSALTFRTGAGSIQTTALNTLSIGGNTTGVLSLSPTGSNFVGIGTQSPLASLDVRNALGFPGGGTLPIASISGRTSFAALQVDNTLGDLFSASSSGLNRFVIKQNGNVGIGTATPGARLALAVSNNVEGGIKFGDDANLFRSGTSTLASLNNFFVGSAGTDIGTTGYVASNSAVDSTNTLHNEDVFESSNVRIGSDGFFRAAYVDENNAYLQYAQCTNIDCSSSNLTTVDNVAHTHGSWLTMGNDGFGRIVYRDTNLAVLNFLRCTNASCSTNNKTTINFSGEQLDVPFLIASDGFARIVFTDQITNNLTFMQCTNADCTATASAVLDATDGSSLNAPFALGSDNFARIIYTDQGSGDLNFVQCTNASCSTRNTTTIVSSDFSSPDYLAIASDGFARFVYANATSGDLNFVQCTNASCSTRNTTAIDAGDFSDHNATSLGTDGFARIVFTDNGNNDLVYVQCTNASCSTSNTSVLDTGDASWAYTLALDGSNNAQIVFQDGISNIFYGILCTNADCSTNTGQIAIGTGNAMNSWSASYVGGDGAFRFSFMDTTMYLQVGVLSRHSYNPNGNELYLAGDLGVNNNIFADGSIFVGGSTNIAGDLNLEGTLNANGGLNLTDNLSIGGTLTVTGASTFNDSVTINSSLQTSSMYSYGYTNYNFFNNGGVVYTNGSGTFAQTSVGSAGQCLQSIGGGAPTWGSCGGSTTFTANAGAIVQSNTTMDVLFGGTSTSSAKVAFTNFNGAAGTINNWANTTDTGLSGQLEQFGLVFLNGYVYHVGGYDGPTVLDTVRYARVKNDGTLDNWVTSPNTLPEARLWHGTVTVNGYIYVIGGHSSVATPTNPAVYFAKVNADGTVGAWSSTTSIPSPRIRITHSVAAANGYIYVVGGENSSAQTTVWYAKVNADGTVGAWTSGSSLPVATSDQAVVVDNGYIYSMGGLAPSATNAIYYAKLNYDGSIGPWIGNPNNLASADTMHSGIAVNGFVYILGGINNSTTVYFAKFNSDGTIPAFSTNPASLPESHQGSGITYGNGYIYISGGFGTDNVAYGSIARVSLAANLDLLGLTSTSLASSSGIAGGGSIFAGNIFSKNLEVAGSGTIWGNLAVSNTLSSSSLSVSGRTSGKALAIFNETGNQDIFTASASGLTKFIIANSGNVGIGTALSPTGANPTSPLQVYGLSTQPIASISGKTSAASLLITNDGTGDLFVASVAGVQKFRINASGDLIIGDGSGKIYGGGFDPLYTIDGQKFSTYASSINGMKEEYIGTANLAYDAAAGGYAYTLDFNNFEYGTELWTFSRVIDPDLTKVNVLLTPTSQARTWFRRDPVNRKLILYSDRPTSVTFRFTAPRFDYALYPSSNHSHDIAGLQAPSAPGTTGSGEADPMDSFFASLSIQFNNSMFTILDGFGNVVHRVDGFSNLMAANLEAGFIHARNLAVDTFTAGSASLGNATANTFAVAANTITIGGQDIRQFIIDTVTSAGFTQNPIVSPLAEVDQIKTNTLSPLASGGDIKVKSKLVVTPNVIASDSAAISLEVNGSASISGNLTVNDIRTNNATLAGSLTTTNASISGTLAAGDINVNQLQIRDNLKVGTVRADFGIFEQGITSMGPVTANILTATDQLAVGSNFTISNNAINTVGTELAIQSLRQGDISFEGGLIRMDTDGNMTVNGNFNLLGEIDAVYGVFSGTLTTPALATDLISPVADSDISLSFKDSKFNIQNSKTATGSAVLSIDNKGNIQSSGSATFAKLNFNLVGKAEATSLTEAVASGSAGFATLRAGQPEITIKNPNVTSKSLIYITPFGNTNGRVLYLLRQVPQDEVEDGSFTVGASGATNSTDLQFNWLIVN